MLFRFLILAALACGLGAPSASASLTYSLRLVGGATTKNSLTLGEVLNIELIAFVKGSDANTSNDGFQEGYVSVLSPSGGNVRGNLSGTLVTTFAASGSQNGTSQDLSNGIDSDKDLGSNLTASNGDFIRARAASMQTTSGTLVNGGREFKLADLTFTVTQIINPLDPTPISLFARVTNFTSPIEIEAIWQEDGIGSSMVLTQGGTFPNSFPTAAATYPDTSVTVGAAGTITLRAIPEPGCAALLFLGGCLASLRRPRARR
jgi:hypothetical protein